MKALIKGSEMNVKVTSLILEIDSLAPDLLTMFHCPKDRTPLFQYAGELIMIVPGGTKAKLPFLVECRNCKTKYLVNSMI